MRKRRVPRKWKKAAKLVMWDAEPNGGNAEMFAVVTGRVSRYTKNILFHLKSVPTLYEMLANGNKLRLQKRFGALAYCQCAISKLKTYKEWKEYLGKRKRL